MTNVTVTFLGKENSGKSYLINRLKNNTFAPVPRDNTGVFYQVAYKDGAKLQIWDIRGTHLKRLAKPYLRDCNTCVYTLDLSEPLDEEQLAANIALVREAAPDTVLILAGCKNDLEQKVSAQQLLALQDKYKIDHVLSTSSLTGKGIDKLLNLTVNRGTIHKVKSSLTSPKPNLDRFTIEEIMLQLDKTSPLYKAIENLQLLIKDLYEPHRNTINQAIIDLITKLYKPNEDKNEAIKDFVETCDEVLQDATKLGFNKETIAKISNGVCVLAAASVVSVAATSLFFGFGLATLVFGGAVGAGIVGAYLLSKRGLFASNFKTSLDGINDAVSLGVQESIKAG